MVANLDMFFAAFDTHPYMVGVQRDFAGAYWAILGYREMVQFVLDLLTSGDFAALDLQGFFATNSIFPCACGGTPSEALTRLDRKVGMLYDFHCSESSGSHSRWKATLRFALRAEFDPEPDEPITTYEVHWNDILIDLYDAYQAAVQADDLHWYTEAIRLASKAHYRNLYALLQVTYQFPEPIG